MMEQPIPKRIDQPAPPTNEVSASEWLGQRCRMRYGLGTIATDWSDKGLFGVIDEVGYWWLCDEDEVRCAECGVPLYLGHDPECGGGQDV